MFKSLSNPLKLKSFYPLSASVVYTYFVYLYINRTFKSNSNFLLTKKDLKNFKIISWFSFYNTSFSIQTYINITKEIWHHWVYIYEKGLPEKSSYLFLYSNTKQILITNYLRRSCIIERATETEKSNVLYKYNHLQFLKWNFEVLYHCHKSKLLLN